MKCFVVLFLGLFVIVSESAFDVKYVISWDTIVESIDPKANGSWIDAAAPDGWNMPVMSLAAAKKFALYLTGNPNPSSWNNFCVKENWKYPIAIYPGLDEVQVAKCTSDPKVVAAWNCTYWSDKLSEKKAIAFTSLTDNSDYLLEVRVWENQEKDWIIFSPNKNITQEQTDVVLKHVETLGFNNKEFINVDYSECKQNTF